MISPFGSRTVAVTSDWPASRYLRVARSDGVRTAGATFRPPTAGGGSAVPIGPVALLASGAAIAQVERWAAETRVASHGHATRVPVPEPVPTTVPDSSRTVTVQFDELER